jgi:hypothetical protein
VARLDSAGFDLAVASCLTDVSADPSHSYRCVQLVALTGMALAHVQLRFLCFLQAVSFWGACILLSLRVFTRSHNLYKPSDIDS